MKRKILSAVLGAVLTLGALAAPAAADEVRSVTAESYLAAKLPTLINNVGKNTSSDEYLRAKPVTSYLSKANGNYMRIQYQYGSILVEYYDKNFSLKSSKLIDVELPIFGGFYETESNYYILSGQENPEENDTVEVFRVTKYDINWNRLSSVSLYGENTVEPFRPGSARMAHYGNTLVIRTSHKMYKYHDGINHQANVTIILNTDTMTVTEANTHIGNHSTGYCAHSFNQFVICDGENFIGLDHGDAYPRSVVLNKWAVDYDYAPYNKQNYNQITSVSMLNISGRTGDNETGVTLGGFEFSDSSYIAVGSTIDQSKFGSSNTRNIFVSVIDKNCTVSSNPTVKKITNYAEGEPSPSNPQLIKINENKFILMWADKAVYDKWNDDSIRPIEIPKDKIGPYIIGTTEKVEQNKVYYIELNGKGEIVGNKYSLIGELSDCQPIVCDGKILWYVCDWNKLSFYSIDANDLSKNNVTNIYTEKPAKVSDYGIEKLRSTSTIKINWKAADRASSYVIKYSTDGRSWKTVTADTNTCNIKKLKAGTKYYIKIAAKNSVGTSDYCKTFTITTKKKK